MDHLYNHNNVLIYYMLLLIYIMVTFFYIIIFIDYMKKIIVLFITIIILFIIIINSYYNKENFICVNKTTYNNKGCKSDLKQISNPIDYCSNNDKCNGYISVNIKDKSNNENTVYFKCFDNWSGELYQKDLINDKLKEIYKDFDYQFSNLKTYKCNNNCPPGKGIIDDSNTCLDCPDKQYNTGDSYQCKNIANCPTNYSLINYDKKTGNISCEINAKPGFYYDLNTSTVKPCPVGQYQNEARQTSCKQCPKGQYQNSTGQSVCKRCPEGHYQNLTGQTSCKRCPAGQYQYLLGQSSCGVCSTGYYSTGGSSWCSKITSISSCPSNKYRVHGNSTRNSHCAYIPSGHERIKDTLDIRRCPPGKVSSGGAYSWYAGCEPCPDNSWQDLSGQSYCYSTPKGAVTLANKTGYSLCPHGTDNRNLKGCEPCPDHQYSATREGCKNCSSSWCIKKRNGKNVNCVPCEYA